MYEKQTATVSRATLPVGNLRDPLLMSAVPIMFATLLLAATPAPTWGQCQSDESIGLTALVPKSNEGFGHAVAADGDLAIVGAPAMSDHQRGGAAYTFRYNGSKWLIETILIPRDTVVDDHFGNAVAISGDTAVVAAHYDDDACPEDHNCDSGSAYVFHTDGAQWTQVAKLTASDALMWDNFGNSVAIDGDTIVVGANLDDGVDANTGSVYVFVKPPGGWTDMTESYKLIPVQPLRWSDEFGASVSISGSTIAVGCNHDDDANPEHEFCESGAVYVFEFDGAEWTQVAKLTAANAVCAVELGYSVSISGDTILAGAWIDDEMGIRSGAAYVFTKPVGGWRDITESAKLNAWDAAAEDRFGQAVSLNGDIAVIGAPAGEISGIGPGSAYAFQYTGGNWVPRLKLLASDRVENALFGFSLAVTEQGRGFVGSPHHPAAARMNAGSAYVFHSLTQCDDGLFCNGAEACVDDVCQRDPDPCPAEDCDDVNDVCTSFICDDDGVCESGEYCYNCPNDCILGGLWFFCGDRICQPSLGEDCLSCVVDCNGKQSGAIKDQFCCGDGDGYNPVGCEDQRCTTDTLACFEPIDPYCCGDDTCESAEDSTNCPLDCGPLPYCGDATCDEDENQCSCPDDCGTPPGNEVPGSTCFDGIDNDCDTGADCADTDCYGIDPNCPDCLPAGEPCTTDAECCSGDCHQAKNTCR